VGRAGWSQVNNLGLTELAAMDDQAFVNTAVAWASDLKRLRELRPALRRQLTNSPLMDAPRFARTVEAGYRDAWLAWVTRP
jgi:protein O-GlcNAc transferase